MNDTASPVFVVGTGRSGTHFMTSILINASELTDLNDGKENKAVFKKVARSAIYEKNVSDLADIYQKLVEEAHPLRLVDQSHPNLWRMEVLLEQFCLAKFLCMIRNPYSVAYSTLNHEGVRRRLEGDRWKNYPNPSQFFGIEGPFIASYEKFNILERCALRWSAHVRRIALCVEKYPRSCIPVRYERLLTQPEKQCKEIEGFINIDSRLFVNNPKVTSLNKKDRLSIQDKKNIERVIVEYFSYFECEKECGVVLGNYLED